MKGAATTELLKEGMHPFAEQPYRNGALPTPWTRKSWSVFLDCAEDVDRAVRYVDENPEKEGKPRQHWSFLKKWSDVA